MNIITKLFSKLNKHITSYGWVPKEDYDELRNSAMYIDEQYKNNKLLVKKLEEELISVKYFLAEKEKVLDESKSLNKTITVYAKLNKYLWALLFISIFGNLYQALI